MRTFDTLYVARRGFIAVLEERISSYTIRIEQIERVNQFSGSDCSELLLDARGYWIGILKRAVAGEKIARDSQPGDLFAKVYQHLCLPPEEYEVVSAEILG